MSVHAEIKSPLCLEDFYSMIESSVSVLVKKTRDERETYRVVHSFRDDVEESFFLKRYLANKKSRWPKRIVQPQAFQTQAIKEWNALRLFSDFHFPVPKPVAILNAPSESFVLMSEVDSRSTLQDWFKNHPIEQYEKERADLIERLAVLTRKMHEKNLHHQDYYLGHFLFDDSLNRISLIDLGRAGRMKVLRRKWIIKDLAQLHFSSVGCWNDQEFLQFIRLYMRNSSFESLMSSILSKSMKIALHSKKHQL